MADSNFTFSVDDKLKEKFEKKADSEQRTIAGQLRWLMEAYTDNKLELKS